MSASFALRKLLYANIQDEDVTKRGYHYTGSYEPLLGSICIFQPSAVAPRSGLTLASLCFGACTLGCLTMKTRNNEKWWFGLFLLATFYYNSVKAHKVNNGLVGHQCGFLASALGTIGCACRLVVHSGSSRTNRRLLAIFIGLMWYEIGRYHLWAEHVTEFKRDITPERYHNLLTEYVPQNIEVEFLPYRGVSS
ncbi:unnamed protein product [Phytomonas sp. Hart1]|nr:unnamed protein product [Phytomonas sp. Hart1]|eukprot:CCW67259.1 unnamed protein product [Phytomonas sp. isolate Hart1]